MDVTVLNGDFELYIITKILVLLRLHLCQVKLNSKQYLKNLGGKILIQ